MTKHRLIGNTLNPVHTGEFIDGIPIVNIHEDPEGYQHDVNIWYLLKHYGVGDTFDLLRGKTVIVSGNYHVKLESVKNDENSDTE